MSIFGKPLSQLTTADLQELLQDKATENARLEFKREVPGRDETLKEWARTVWSYVAPGPHPFRINWDDTKPNGAARKLLDVSRMKEFRCCPQISPDIGIPQAYKDFMDRVHGQGW